MKKKIDIDLSLGTQNAKKSLSSLKDSFAKISRDMSKTFDKSFNQGALKNSISLSSQLTNNIKEMKVASSGAGAEISNIASSLAGIISGKKSTKDTLIDLIKGAIAPQQNTGNLFSSVFGGSGFASGGIVPGGFSQAVPATLHGSEMVLNPSQQANLFKIVNGQGQTEAKQTPSYVYAPQIQTGASAHEVFDVLQKHSRQFFSMVAEGVSSNNNLRNAVRSA